MLDICNQLFSTWNNQSIQYCHWKSNEHLMEGLDGKTDLDVLLLKNHKEQGCALLKELGFLHFFSQFASRYPNVEDWLGFDAETGKLVHLHLHFAMVTGHTGIKEYELPWTNEALLSRIQDKETGVYIINPNLELITLYTRLVLKAKPEWIKAARAGNYSMDKHFHTEITFIKERIIWIEFETLVEHYYGEYSEDFIQCAKADILSAEQFLKLYDIVCETMKSCLRFRGLSLTIRRFFYPIVKRMKTKLNNHWGFVFVTKKVADPLNGFSVAFIGQDGSGKSTVTSDIKKWLNWKVDARRFYLGSGDYRGILKRLLSRVPKTKQVSEKATDNKVSTENNEPKNKKKKSIKSFIVAVLTAEDFVIIARRAYKEACKAEKYRRKGGVVLYDRFPQIQFEGINDGPKVVDYYTKTGLDYDILKLMAKKEMRYLRKTQRYRPQIVFKLLLPPEESQRRRPSDNIEFLRRKHEITKALQFDGSKILIVDATQDYQQELIYIKNVIWKYLKESQQ